MKKIITLLSLMLFVSVLSFGQHEKYSQVKISLKPDDIQMVASLGIAVDAGFYDVKAGTFTTALTGNETERLTNAGLHFEVEIDDLEAYYAARNAGIDPKAVRNEASRAPADYPVPYNFELGSCGGFCTVDECYEHLDKMYLLYPNLITEKAPVSEITTIEGRPVYYVKITGLANVPGEKPQVLYTGMHHAREPIGMQHLLYYMYYLLENYETNEAVRTLVDHTEMYFIPIINPDGYIYNITTSPNGGGMWRKNRSISSGGHYGVDLNRNYGFAWGYDDVGSSPYPSSDTYRGTAAFSEPETRIIKEFCEAHNFKIALNYHSYSNLLLYAWGYIKSTTPDESAFAEYARRMTVDNSYTYGPSSTTIYVSNGGSDDWMYGEQTTKNKTLAYTPEVGSQYDGFWPAVERIIPQCQENMIQSLNAARFSGPYGELADLSPMIIEKKTSQVRFELKRIGQTPADYTITIEPISENIVSTGNPVTIKNLMVLQTRIDSIAIELNDNIKHGEIVKYALTLDNGLYLTHDTIEKFYGIPVTVFYDDIPDLGKWSGQWGLYSSFPYSPPYCIADSPVGFYANNANTSITTKEQIDLTNASAAFLSFYARWRIEAGYDYVQLLVSTNNGTTWSPLAGKHTRKGSQYQATGQPVYDGEQNQWIKEEVNLKDYTGKQILLRFNLRSDMYTNADGFFFDNMEVTMLDITTGIKHSASQDVKYIAGPWPNPAESQTRFSVNIPGDCSNTAIVIYDISGREVAAKNVNKNQGDVNIDISPLDSGVYLCKLMQHGKTLGTLKLIKL